MRSALKYNVIGDIHGRTCWKNLVKDECVNIFVGDYFDPYDEVPFAEIMQNFYDIIAYKKKNPQTVLLYGNHDLHYISSHDRSSRYDEQHAEQIKQLFSETESLFTGVAYAIENKILVTHAGVSKEWYEKEFGAYKGVKPSIVAKDINDLWKHNKMEFAFKTNAASLLDMTGTSPSHSPLWIRPEVLADHNLFSGTSYLQIFGHTQMDNIMIIDECLICVDCLGRTIRSYQYP